MRWSQEPLACLPFAGLAELKGLPALCQNLRPHYVAGPQIYPRKKAPNVFAFIPPFGAMRSRRRERFAEAIGGHLVSGAAPGLRKGRRHVKGRRRVEAGQSAGAGFGVGGTGNIPLQDDKARAVDPGQQVAATQLPLQQRGETGGIAGAFQRDDMQRVVARLATLPQKPLRLFRKKFVIRPAAENRLRPAPCTPSALASASRLNLSRLRARVRNSQWSMGVLRKSVAPLSSARNRNLR